MQCLSPIRIKNPTTGQFITVPCSRCAACLATRRAGWSFRLENELKVSSSAHFITLTYDDDNIFTNDYGNPSVSKSDVQSFIKRLRNNYKTSLRYYAVSEYGSKTHRPHYHIIMFNMGCDETINYNNILNSWGKGQIHIGQVTPASIAYVTKYVFDKGKHRDGENPVFALMSRKPGLGSNYIQTHAKWHHKDSTRFYSVKEGGVKVPLPRFYKDKLYSKMEKDIHAKKCADLSTENLRKAERKHTDERKHFATSLQERKENYARQIEKNHKKNDKL